MPLSQSSDVNRIFTLLPSAVRTGNLNSIINLNGYRAALFFINISAVPGVSSLTFDVRNIDPLSNVASPVILSSGVITAISLVTVNVSSQIIGNVIVSPMIRFDIVQTGAGNFTYSVSYILINNLS